MARANAPEWASPVFRLDWLSATARHPELGDVAVRIAVYLHSLFNAEHGGAWMAQPRIAAELGLSVKTIGNALRELERHGFLRHRRRRHSTNVYWPEMPTPFGSSLPKEMGTGEGTFGTTVPNEGRLIRQSDARVIRHRDADKPQLTNSEDDHLSLVRTGSDTSLDWPDGDLAALGKQLCQLLPLSDEETARLLLSTGVIQNWRRNGLPWRAVQLGVLLTAGRSRAVPASFAYFGPEIVRCAADPDLDRLASADALEALRRSLMPVATGERAVEPLGTGEAPPEVFTLVRARLGEDSARSYLHNSQWDAAKRSLTPATGTAFRRLHDGCHRQFFGQGITLVPRLDAATGGA